MHVLFVHQNFPAQFGHIARYLVGQRQWRCTFLSETPTGEVGGIEKIQYRTTGGATANTHFCSRTFENTVWHCDAIYNVLRERSDIRPDLIVGHSGFGSTLFLRELFPATPVVNLFEYYYRAHDPDSDMDFRTDLGWQMPTMKYLRSYCRNAMILLDLQNCQVGYCPTAFQRSRFPDQYQPKLKTIFDGVDRSIYHGFDDALRPPMSQRTPRTIAGVEIGPTTRVVTYVSRGFESMRGFDIFMRSAQLIGEQFPDVAFIVVGTDKMTYGGDEQFLNGHPSFKEWVLAQRSYDLSKIHFVGRLTENDLARTLAASDLHIYLTVPFVLSWSMMDAMSCGAVVLGSRTSPVKEMIEDGANGLLADFFSPEEFAAKAVPVLQDPDAARSIGRAAEQMIIDRYSLEAVMPRMLTMYEEAMAGIVPSEPRAVRPTFVPIVEPDESVLPPAFKRRSPFLG